MALEFRTLRYFVAVAEELHFSRAAERLHIAQPALSDQIKRLENELGVELFRRTTRKVELTTAGGDFLARARRILHEGECAQAEAARTARGMTGSIRIATGATAGLELVPEILRAFGDTRRRMHIDLQQLDWEDYFGGLSTAAVDAAFLWLPVEHDELTYAALHTEPRVATLSSAHALASQSVVRVEQLVDEVWPWVDTYPAARAFWTCEEVRGGPATWGPTVRSMEGVLEAVRAGLCVATVPRSQALVSDLPGIAYRPIEGLPPATLVIAWRTNDDTSAVRSLVETARQVALRLATSD